MVTSHKTVPRHAQVVIAGGGIVGCSTAYHLAQMGCRDVVLLEQYELTAGTTWHAAGAIGQLRTNANITRLLNESVKLYDQLETLVGQPAGWLRNGSIRLALTPERRSEYEIAATVARSFGIEYEMISAKDAGEIIPQMYTGDVLCAAFVPSDGVANPSDITQALAKGARKGGVTIIEGVKITGCSVKDSTVASVATDQGEITCEVFVNCAGIWARELGRMAGVNVPLQPSHHQYFVTERIEGLVRNVPAVRDPDKLTYFKEEVGGLSVGGYELNPIPFLANPIPDDHKFKLMEPAHDHFEPLLASACERFPVLKTTGVKQWFNGVESFTEDGMFIIGEAPEVRNYFVAAGFNAFGIAAGGGAGMALAHWVLNKEPPFDLWAADIRRFASLHRSNHQVLIRSLEGQAGHYKLHFPFEEAEAGRGLRRSAIYDRLKQEGACLGTKFGWERANWFMPGTAGAKDEYSFGRQNWFAYVAAEHQACRERAAIFDQTSFAKFRMTGKDATTVLQYLCANNIAQEDGKIVYTSLLNARGGFEADLTVTRLGENDYLIITGAGSATRDFSYISRHVPEGSQVCFNDVTSSFGCLSLMGPLARHILGKICENDISNEAFPLFFAKNIIVAGAPVLALRLGFVGELGWELYTPPEYVAALYEALKSAGAEFGVADAGYRAIDSLRMEKGRRLWGIEVGPDDTPLEAGVGFAVDLEKPDFIGRSAIIKQWHSGVGRRLCTFSTEDPDVVLYGKETIYRDGKQVGYLASAGYGHTLGFPLGMGYVSNPDGAPLEWIADGTYELGLANTRVAAQVYTSMIYDSLNERVNA